MYHKLNVLTTETNLGTFEFTYSPAQSGRVCNVTGRAISSVISDQNRQYRLECLFIGSILQINPQKGVLCKIRVVLNFQTPLSVIPERKRNLFH